MIEYNGVSMDAVIFALIVGTFLAVLIYLEVMRYRTEETTRGFVRAMLRKADEKMEE